MHWLPRWDRHRVRAEASFLPTSFAFRLTQLGANSCLLGGFGIFFILEHGGFPLRVRSSAVLSNLILSPDPDPILRIARSLTSWCCRLYLVSIAQVHE